MYVRLCCTVVFLKFRYFPRITDYCCFKAGDNWLQNISILKYTKINQIFSMASVAQSFCFFFIFSKWYGMDIDSILIKHCVYCKYLSSTTGCFGKQILLFARSCNLRMMFILSSSIALSCISYVFGLLSRWKNKHIRQLYQFYIYR